MNATEVLLVDDEEGIRRVLGLVLQDFGYKATTAPGGQEALELLAARAPEDLPAIVLTDIKMPGLDGLQLLKTVRKDYPELEVVMLTGHGDMDLAISSLRLGAGDFLHKPVADGALEVALQRAAQRRKMRADLRRYQENLEQLVRRRTHELLEAERFAAVGETAASLAHSIKNIAGALEGTMFVLEKGLELNKREYFEEGWTMIRGDVARLKKLAVGLLSLGRRRPPNPRLCSPPRPLADVAAALRARAAEDGTALELALPEACNDFWLDAEAVHECLFNLAMNALEAVNGRPGARVRLSLECFNKNNQPALRYCVSDNGPGLPESLNAQDISGFTSGKKNGTGIGLFSTRKLAREMGAELRLESGPSGASAYLEFL